MSTEAWRPIPGYAGYEVSDRGRVVSRQPYRGSREPRLMSATPNEWGYLTVHLSAPNGGAVARVHALVLLAFEGERPNGAIIRHLDGDPANNSLENLRYGTPSQNAFDQVEHGTHPFASRTHCKYGHEYTPSNTAIQAAPEGRTYRQCKACNRARVQRQRDKTKAVAA